MNPDISKFVEYPKTPRLSKDIIITEKIDGTNAQVVVYDLTPGSSDFEYGPHGVPWLARIGADGCRLVAAGSRNRWLDLAHDNFGFARWVLNNAEELAKLGPGRRYGEWWGCGIQRGYGLDQRRFSLFNTLRWDEDTWEHFEAQKPMPRPPAMREPFVPPPACCFVVPVLYAGPFETGVVREVVTGLGVLGSKAAPGFMNPEGVVVFHTGANQCFKAFCDPDE